MIVQSLKPELPLAHIVLGEKGCDVGKKLVHDGQHMGEMSPGQQGHSGIFRESRAGRIPCDIGVVATSTAIAAIRARIEREMKSKGFSRRSLSAAAGLSESAVRDVLDRTQNPGIGTLQKIADALEMPIDALTGEIATVPVLGDVGAGGAILFTSEEDDASDHVPRPPLAVGRLMALRVLGSSMLPKYEEGDVIYVARDHDGILPAYLGRYCAIRTADGGTFLKVLSPGSEAGRYTLRSLNAPDMENVEVVWASPVLFVMPRREP